jgi:hypothetical protein
LETGFAEISISPHFSTIALARGCSLFASRAKAIFKSAISETSSAGMISVTEGVPLVMVPVLSRTTISVLPASSREAAVL